METPNPENIVVGTANFHIDPTHIRPLPPQLLSFLPEYYGFKRVKTLRLQELSELKDKKVLTLFDVLNGVSPDYAVVAQKDGATEIFAATNPAFEAEYGLTLESLAVRYNQQAEAKAQRAETLAHQAEAKAQRAETLAQQIQSNYQSHSWCIAAPLRWVGHQVRLLRQHGLGLRLKALIKKIVLPVVRYGAAFLYARPGLRHRCVALIRRFGLYDFLRSFYFRLSGQQDFRNSPSVLGQSAESNLTVDQLSPRARQIYADLQAAISDCRKENR